MTSVLEHAEKLMTTAGAIQVCLSLFALRRLPGEPSYSVTIRWHDDRPSNIGKGKNLTTAMTSALTGLPISDEMPNDEVDWMVNEMRYRHITFGISGLAEIEPQSRFFANARFNFDPSPLLRGRGPDLRTAMHNLRDTSK